MGPCEKICDNKTENGYCKSTACINANTYLNTSSTTTATSYIYTGNAVDKICDTCAHRDVCKFREKTEEAIRNIPSKREGPAHIIVKLECEFYQARYYSYPTITYGNSDNSEWWKNHPWEVTCKCSEE